MVAFLDTNVVIYGFTDDPRSHRAHELPEQRCVIGVQVLNEFANVARRKLGMTWPETREALAALRVLCPGVVPLTVDIHENAIALAERYGIGMFDALVVASALHAGCDTLWSEDMHHGLIVQKRLRIANPFVGR